MSPLLEENQRGENSKGREDEQRMKRDIEGREFKGDAALFDRSSKTQQREG
jgi:hypothetical protein